MKFRFKLLSDVSLSGLTGDDLKAITEATCQDKVQRKHGHLKFNSSYSPCVSSTNLSSKEEFHRRAKEAKAKGSGSVNMDEHDWQCIFDDASGRMYNVYFGQPVPAHLRSAPSHPAKGNCHGFCVKCSGKTWRWCTEQYLHPRAFAYSDIFDCSSDESDMEDQPKVGIRGLKTRSEIEKWLSYRPLQKMAKSRKNLAARATAKAPANEKVIKVSEEELQMLAKRRGAKKHVATENNKRKLRKFGSC